MTSTAIHMTSTACIKIAPKHVADDQTSKLSDSQNEVHAKEIGLNTETNRLQTQNKSSSPVSQELKLYHFLAPKEPDSGTSLGSPRSSKKIDLSWENLNIQAKIKKTVIENGKKKIVRDTKTILNNISGSVKHGRFTAIMGPSGGGKTTLLNFLSARISGKELTIHGAIKVNGHLIDSLDRIASVVAYIMQDDILQATMTPREALMFVADLRLRIPYAEKKKKVDDLLSDLGLKHVANTRIGNNLLRGLSGGERKRTSIGVELMTDPSLIFLDEPTTGLDSKTAQNVINLLVGLAKKSGRTIVSTIHQPSSQIYTLFDELILLVRGNIIYQGAASSAIDYFAGIGFPCPKLTNPSDYFMKIMNESGIIIEELEKTENKTASKNLLQMGSSEIESRFQERLTIYNKAYHSSGMAKQALEISYKDKLDVTDHVTISWVMQFWYIFVRKCQDQIRNPMEVKVKIIQKIIFAILIVLSASDPGVGQLGIQNRYGLFFFFAIMCFMAGLQGSVGTFAAERPIFVRERLSRSYSTSSYFWAKVAAEMPLLAAQPAVLVVISYFAVGLDRTASKFFILLVISILNTVAASGFGLLLSTFVPTMEMAMSLVSLINLPIQLFSGIFVSQDHIPDFLKEFQYIAPTKYAFQAAAVNEFNGLDICDGCNPLVNLGTYQGLGLSIGILAIIGVVLRIIAYMGLVFISSPKKAKVLPPKEAYN